MQKNGQHFPLFLQEDCEMKALQQKNGQLFPHPGTGKSNSRNAAKKSCRKMGSISACFLEEKSRIETRQKILSEKWAAFPLVFSRKWPEESLATEKWTAFPHSVTGNSRSRRPAKNSRRKMGSISSCFYTRNSKIETLQKILVEKWAAFPPVLTRNCKIEDLQKILAENGQHFVLFLHEKL